MKPMYDALQENHPGSGCLKCPFAEKCGEEADGYTHMDEYGTCPKNADDTKWEN